MKRAAVALVALAAMTLLAPLPAGACSCVARTIEEQAAAATTVFEGTVRSTEQNAASFDVDRMFKGAHADRITVATGDPSSTCSVPVVPGRNYVVFAANASGTLATDLCSGTTDDTSVGDRIAAGLVTGSPSPFETFRALPPVTPSRNAPIGIAAGILAIVTAVFAANVIRRRPRPVA